MSHDAKKLCLQRKRHQHILWPIVVIVIAFGWHYPLLGFSVPAVMLMGVVGGALRGRYVCGHLCPRGGFFDRVIAPLSRKKPIPAFFRNRGLRWALFILLMAFMLYRIALNPTDVFHWGRVFWLMCVITTAIGIVLGILIHPRAWCSFCPMGTLQSALDRGNKQLRIDSSLCIECRACEKACPMNLAIVPCKAAGGLADPDCLKCPECSAVCPRKALKF
jgi:ferredoxin-type protein NapH